MKQNKKHVFVRLEQGLEDARTKAHEQAAQQEAAPQEPCSGQNAANAPPQSMPGMGYMPYMQPMYMPYMPYMQMMPPMSGGNPQQMQQPQQMPQAQQTEQEPQAQEQSQASPQGSQQPPQPFVQPMPPMPLLTCVPNAHGQPQWVQIMPMPPMLPHPQQPQAEQPQVQPQQSPPQVQSQQQQYMPQPFVSPMQSPFVQPQYMQPPFVQPQYMQPQQPQAEQPPVQQPQQMPTQVVAESSAARPAEPLPTQAQAAQTEPVKAQPPKETAASREEPLAPQTEEPQTGQMSADSADVSTTPQAAVREEPQKSPPEPPKEGTQESENAAETAKTTETAEAVEAAETLADEDFTRKKNRMKQGRVVLEVILLVATVWILIELFFTIKTYEPFASAAVSEEDHGFIALSYFGVDRNGETSTLIGKEQLRLHLAELKEQGYVTISQQDVLDYYQNGKPLPPRSLFLMFEDGRRDTAIFAQEIMEDLNLKATMMTYPEKFVKEDTKFLGPKDLKELESSTFWELGSNGYRLAYINVFDRYGDFLGELDPLRFNLVSSYLDRRYNHFLMDYIRDKDGIPTESERQMERRVTYDYTRLREIYEEELGYVPRAHVLMHANTGSFGNNPRVSAVNERWIREIFPMNFNREGFVLNKRGSSLYDLTRMQPQPYWPINHLLMRINYDTDGSLSFVEGREEGRRAWDLKEGALECKEETLILTTLPEGKAVARLADVEDLRDVCFEAELAGNAFGSQQIFLRSSVDLAEAIGVVLVNDHLVVEEIKGGEKHELYREKLPIILGEKILSVEEARQQAKVGENEAFARYATSPAAATEYMGRANEERETYVATVEDGADPYEGRASFHRRSKCKLTIHLKDDRLSVEVDGHMGPENLAVSRMERGGIFLGSSWQGEAWSQRNLADDVYDGVFKKVRILQETGQATDEEQVLYSSEYTGMEKMQHRAKEIWESVLRWFLDYV